MIKSKKEKLLYNEIVCEFVREAAKKLLRYSDQATSGGGGGGGIKTLVDWPLGEGTFFAASLSE